MDPDKRERGTQYKWHKPKGDVQSRKRDFCHNVCVRDWCDCFEGFPPPNPFAKFHGRFRHADLAKKKSQLFFFSKFSWQKIFKILVPKRFCTKFLWTKQHGTGSYGLNSMVCCPRQMSCKAYSFVLDNRPLPFRLGAHRASHHKN